ncbi:MAG: M81 family metallopeptidase [Alphaproteobacteria bacterium]|nr:M81 family metallopeptidase [Alphaproteobacteria bacterium]
MKRIGMLRIAQESNALAPVLSEVEDFAHDREGDDLLQATRPGQTEVIGFMKDAELSGFCRAVRERPGFEIVPLFSVWAFPAGPLSHRALATFRERLRRALDAAGPLDGLFVSLHGAMVGEEGSRPETVLLDDLRDLLGPDLPIAASIDLHAHLTPDFVDPLTLIVAYRTNPHRDHADTGYRAGRLLLDVMQGELRPRVAWRHLPMVMGGGNTLDFLNPMRRVFRRMAELERHPRVASVSLCMSHLWLDAPDLGWSTYVVTHDDPELAERIAEELADLAWSVRFELPPEFPDPLTAIDQARAARLRRRLGTVCMADASDLVGAGAPGDNTRLLGALLDHARDMRCLAAIRDTPTAQALYDERIGSTQRFTVGGRYPGSSPALELTGRVLARSVHPAFGRRVALDVGHVQLVVSEKAPLVAKPSFYRELGLHPSRADITMVKVFFPFRLFFALHNRLSIYAKTEGPTDLDAALRVAFDRPTHPRDFVESWRPADRARRQG